jgi:hypothetical protein
MVQATELQARRVQRAAKARDRRWTVAAIGLGILAVLQFASLTILWFWPYHWAGLLNELGLMAVAVAMGAFGYLLARRSKGKPPLRLGLSAAAALYAIASMAGLGWSQSEGLGLGVHRYALFSTPVCEFAARFASPPQLGRFRDAKFEAERLTVNSEANLAVLADLATYNSYRSECQAAAQENAAAASELVKLATLHLADEIGLKISAQAEFQDQRGAIFELEGEIGGSILPEIPGQKSRTLVGMRSYRGERSVMTLYVFQPLGAELSPASRDFLDGVRRK